MLLPISTVKPSLKTSTQAVVIDFRKAMASLATTGVLLLMNPNPANAILNSPNAQIPRTPEAALRRSIPAFNADVRRIQDKLEDAAFKLRIPQRKPWAAMSDDLKEAQGLANDEERMLMGVLPKDKGVADEVLTNVQQTLSRLAYAMEAKDPDRTSLRLANALEYVGELELLEAPGLPYQLPNQYASFPILSGRAVVELTVATGDGRKAFLDPNSDQGSQIETTFKVVVDGYSAPISSGNFIMRVLRGEYNGMPLDVSEISIISAESKNSNGGLPLEILPAGSFEPMYRSQLFVREGELPTLPLSIYGSVAMTKGDSTEIGTVSDSQFFIYKFDKQQSGLSGLSFDEGEFGVFGYVVNGPQQLSKVEQGDYIKRAEVVSGADRLINVQKPEN